MKKILCLLSASLLVLTSCSKDDNSAATILPQTFGYSANIGKMTYDGSKLVSFVDSDGAKTTYTYTGDVITKQLEYDENGVLDNTIDYSYVAGKLSTSIELETGDDYKYKTKYTDNGDGTISSEDFRIKVTTGVEEEYGYIRKYTFKDGNLVKRVDSYYGAESIYTYEYDAKNNPFKNILGFNLLIENDPAVNNVVKITSVSGSGTNTNTSIETKTYTYNADNFPTEIVNLYNGQSDGTLKITY